MKSQWKSVNNLHDTNVNTNNSNSSNNTNNTNNNNNNNNLTPDASNNVNASSPKSPKPSKSPRSFQTNHSNLSFSKIKSNIKKLFSYSSATKSQSSMEEARSPSVSSLEDLAPYNTQLTAHQLSVSSSRSTNEINKENISSPNSSLLNRTHFTVGVASGLTLKNSIIQNNAVTCNMLLPPLPPVPSNVCVGYNRSESDQSAIRRNSNTVTHPVPAGCNDSSSYSNNLKKNAALNLKIVTPNTPLNFYNDRETLEDLKKKLSYLTEEDHLYFQKLGFNLLYEQCQLKNAQIQLLDKEVQEMNAKLVTKNETLHVQFEIDALKNEIRALTNEKAELEMKIIQNSEWTCPKCTFKNNNQLVCCQICNEERNANEIFICSHCNSRNSIFEQSCRNCQAYLLEVHNPPLACSEHSSHSSLSRDSSLNGAMNSNNNMYDQNNNSARTTPGNSNHSSSVNFKPETPKLTHRPPPPPPPQHHQSNPSPQFYLGSQTSVPNRQTSSSSSGSSSMASPNIYSPNQSYNINNRSSQLHPPPPLSPPPPPYSSTIGQPSIPFVPAPNTNSPNIRNAVASTNIYNPNR